MPKKLCALIKEDKTHIRGTRVRKPRQAYQHQAIAEAKSDNLMGGLGRGKVSKLN